MQTTLIDALPPVETLTDSDKLIINQTDTSRANLGQIKNYIQDDLPQRITNALNSAKDYTEQKANALSERIDSVENLGHYAGAFDTYALLPTNTSAFPQGITINDFATIRADEMHAGSVTRYIVTAISGNVITWGYDLTYSTDITGKADKVSGSVDGNFAGLDAGGNLTDSGINEADFIPASDKGAAGGVATLDENGIVFAEQMPYEGGLFAVATDNTLKGNGTSADPLGVELDSGALFEMFNKVGRIFVHSASSNLTAPPNDAKLNDLILNSSSASRTIGGVAIAIGGLAKITSLSPFACTAAGNIRGATGLQGPSVSISDTIDLVEGQQSLGTGALHVFAPPIGQRRLYVGQSNNVAIQIARFDRAEFPNIGSRANFVTFFRWTSSERALAIGQQYLLRDRMLVSNRYNPVYDEYLYPATGTPSGTNIYGPRQRYIITNRTAGGVVVGGVPQFVIPPAIAGTWEVVSLGVASFSDGICFNPIPNYEAQINVVLERVL